MVGGGPGAFIGPVHRMAAELDRKIELVAGAFSRDADRSRQAGAAWGLAPLQDQQLAGLIMWVPAAGVYLAAALVGMNRWLARQAGSVAG